MTVSIFSIFPPVKRIFNGNPCIREICKRPLSESKKTDSHRRKKHRRHEVEIPLKIVHAKSVLYRET